MNATTRLALLLGLIVGCVNAAACPPGFVASVTIPGKCYYLAGIDNFFSAINYCRNNLTYGADILSIANGFENSEVASLLQARGINYAWTGAVFYDNKLHWIATSAGSSNYSYWGSGNYNGYVALITSSGGWSNSNGGNNYSIVCQIYPDDTTTFPLPQIACPAGWTPSISVRGKCYQQIDGVDFFSAMRRCPMTRIGNSSAELVTLTSQLEMMELYAMQLSSPWTSLTSWEADSYWHWAETLHPTDYYGPYGPPSNSGGTCAYLDNRNLYGAPCWKSQAAVCQYFPDELPESPLPSLNCPQDNNTSLNGIASLTKPGTCYYVLSQYQSFQSARSACRALNNGLNYNDLFVPRTAAEYEEFEAILFNQTSYPTVWLGLTISNGTWGWISGRSSNITNIWCNGQPDTSQYPNDQCAFVISTKVYNNKICWAAGDCRDSYTAICQSSNTF